MVQPKYSPEEALQRMKLLMKYDTSKTLTENVRKVKKPVNEIAVLGFAIPWLTAGLAAAGTAAVAGVGTWIYNVQGGGDAFAKTKLFFEGCNTEWSKLKPTLGKSQHREAAAAIYNAIEGIGTDVDAIRGALSSMPTVADLCAMYKNYTMTYGDLYDDLDSDIDGEDFRKYVWSAIAGQVQDAQEDLQKAKDEPVTDDEKKKTDNNRNKGGGGYKSCSGTYSYGCSASAIREVQSCLGLTADGKFGPKTQAKLKEKGFTSFTDADISKICSKTTTTVDSDEEDVDAADPNQL